MKINAVIVGAQKAGTTSLHRYMCEHPDVEGHFTVEFSSFIVDTEYEKGIPHAIDKFYNLENRSPEILLAKSALFSRDEKAIKRLYKYNPDCKILFLVREPVARAFSCYTFERMNGGMKGKDFDDIVDVLKNKEYEDGLYRLCIGLGLYADHMEKLLKYFPIEQIKVITFKDFKSNSKDVCKDIFSFLSIDQNFNPNLAIKHNKTKVVRSETYARVLYLLKTKFVFIKNIVKFILPYKRFDALRTKILNSNKKEGSYKPMSNETRLYLKNYFKPYNNKLSEMINTDLSHWN